MLNWLLAYWPYVTLVLMVVVALLDAARSTPLPGPMPSTPQPRRFHFPERRIEMIS